MSTLHFRKSLNGKENDNVPAKVKYHIHTVSTNKLELSQKDKCVGTVQRLKYKDETVKTELRHKHPRQTQDLSEADVCFVLKP